MQMVNENTGIIMRCGRCQQQVPLSEMKYAKDGTTLVCRQCRGLTTQEHLAKLRPKEKEPASKGRFEQPRAAVKYQCTNCGFSFIRTNIKPTRCPYCAKPSVIEAKAITSEKLLEESDAYD